MEKDSSISKLAQRQTSDWETWANYWKLLIDSSRPSRQDMNIYGRLINKAIKKIDKPNIVILGSTPELRELSGVYSAGYNANVICVELVEYMYKAMTQLIFQPNKSEKVIFNNWLSMDLPDESADIVIGDLTEGNVAPELRDRYYLEVRRILKKKGKYISRATAFISGKKAKPMVNYDDILKTAEDYKKKILEGELTVQQSACQFGGQFCWESWYKTGGKLLSASAYGNDIKKLDETNEDPVVKKIMEAWHLMWDEIMEKYWNYYTLDFTLENYYKKYFRKVKYYYSKDYPVAKYTPIFEMTKK